MSDNYYLAARIYQYVRGKILLYRTNRRSRGTNEKKER